MIKSRLLQIIPGIEHEFEKQSQQMPDELIRCHQIHSDIVIAATQIETTQHSQADGLFLSQSGRVGIQTADCLPVLFAEKNGKAVAAVHAGWRGLHKGILPNTVMKFEETGIPADHLIVAIGPAIGPCCFEVNQEVIDLFEKTWGHLWTTNPWYQKQPKAPHPPEYQAQKTENNLWLDLKTIAKLQLKNCGILENQIEDLGLCTYGLPSTFASFRRSTHEGKKALRQWSWIGIKKN